MLLVEDDEDVRGAMMAVLGRAGWRVIASDEGRKALELAGALHPSVVVLDLVTGGMNGWEFLERRREDPALSRIPVIVVTGYGRMSLDVQAILHKPVDARELVSVVRRVAESGVPAS